MNSSLQRIKNRFYHIPVGLCSAYDTYKDDIKSVAADFYVVKSSDLYELKGKIAKTLRILNQDDLPENLLPAYA